MGINYEELKNEKESGEYLSGAKLLPGSDVRIFNYLSLYRIIIVDFNLEFGQDNLVMEELILLEI